MGEVGISEHEHEEELLDLLAVAKKQQATIQAATDAMQKQRGELYEAITQLKKMQPVVAAEAQKGVERGLSGVTSQATIALAAEVEKAKRTIGIAAEELRISAWGKSLKWVAGSVAVGFILGFVLCWFMWGRDTRDAVKRYDELNAELAQLRDRKMQEQAPPPAATAKQHTQKRSQSSEPQEQP